MTVTKEICGNRTSLLTSTTQLFPLVIIVTQTVNEIPLKDCKEALSWLS